MTVFLNLHTEVENLDSSTDEYKSVFKTKEIIENVFFEYSGCNFQVALDWFTFVFKENNWAY